MEHSYKKTDSLLETTNEEEQGFKLLHLIYTNNQEGIRKMGVTEVCQILIPLSDYLKDTDAEMLSGPRTNESILITHLRDYVTRIQSDTETSWQTSFLSLLLECGFTPTAIAASLNTHFAWKPAMQNKFDAAARTLGIPPIFSGSAPFQTNE